MITNTNETMLRTATKIEPTTVVHERHVDMQKAEQTKQARPVENSDTGKKAENKTQKEEETSKYLIDEKKVVFEKYNKDGDVILRIPPSYMPVDEMA